ncbi:hypothetical protein [Bacillus sp. NPDC094106]|uniref:hypothetical protein n=1 Tax=Bacillus sp. NPDC094106 TaxID=3363949 RepID=UPI00380CE384
MIILKELQFVTTNGTDIGVIFDFDGDTHVNVMHEDIDNDFGCLSFKDKDVRPMTANEIKKALERIEANFKKHAYFIIELNNIDELEEYHIKENEFVQQARIDSTYFAEDFETHRSDLLQHNGKSFTVLKVLTKQEDEDRMYKIKLSTGEEIDVFEEEILLF